MAFFVYVLKSKKDESCYVESTQNLTARLKMHNLGRSRYTKGHRPWSLIYKEKFDLRTAAVKRERYLKSGVGRKELKQLISS